MAYNYYPVNYQIPQYYPQSMPAVQNNGGVIWIQGEAAAKSYPVAPNTTVQLWDAESQTIFVKSADASGMPSPGPSPPVSDPSDPSADESISVSAVTYYLSTVKVIHSWAVKVAV